jgi:DNA-directed RNA polymerase subunit RPC12/RpoP
MSNRRKARGRESVKHSPHGSFPLQVIPEPEAGTRSVFITDNTDPDFIFVQGSLEDIEYTCGNCGRVLMRGVAPGQVINVVLRCPRCGQFNDTGA